jgi:hypothetical protein
MGRSSKPAPAPASSSPTLLQDVICDLTSDRALFAADGPCPTLYEPGAPRLAVISGENAGGKSLFARAVAALLRKQTVPKIEVMLISMNLRVEPGMHRAFIFNEDPSSSTGNVSVHTALAGLRNSRARENPHILMLDEPDIGLGEAYQAPLGEELADYARNLPSSAVGFLLISHSRALIAPFLPLAPTFVRVGSDLRPTTQWIAEGDIVRTRADLLALSDKARQRYLGVHKLISQK